MSIIKRIKAKLLIMDEFQKLDVLSKELQAGNASEADKNYWNVLLENIESFLSYVPEHQKKYEMYKKRRGIVDHQIRTHLMKKYEGGIIVVSSLRGLFDTLTIQRKKHEQRNDVIVVTGDWMSFENDLLSIHKAMELVEEGVIFLRGHTEEKFLDYVSEESPEAFFISCLPVDVQTPHTIITTGNSKEEPLSIQYLLNNDEPNLTGKTIIAVHPTDGENSLHLKNKELLLLAPGDALRLELRKR